MDNIYTKQNVIQALVIVFVIFVLYWTYYYIFIKYHKKLYTCGKTGETCPDGYWCTSDKTKNGDDICRPCAGCYEAGSSIPNGCDKVPIAGSGYYCDPGYGSSGGEFKFGDGVEPNKCPGYSDAGPPQRPATSSSCNMACANQGYCCPLNYRSKTCVDDKNKGIIAQSCSCVSV